MAIFTYSPARQHYRFSGFLLLEASLALIILGCVSAAILPLVRSARDYHTALQTRRTCTRLCRSLAVYVQRNNRLPWAATNSSGEETADASAGYLPYRTLSLPDSAARASPAGLVYYVVNPNLTAWRVTNFLDDESTWESLPPTEALQILDPTGQPVIADTESDCCALAICYIPPHSEIKLLDLLHTEGRNIQLRIPPRQSGVRVHWVSHNNLLALYAD